MKKLFLIMIAALCLVAVGCKKTCQCTETVTSTYDSDEDWEGFEMDPIEGQASYTKEAKKCSDLNAESTENMLFMHVTTKIECK